MVYNELNLPFLDSSQLPIFTNSTFVLSLLMLSWFLWLYVFFSSWNKFDLSMIVCFACLMVFNATFNNISVKSWRSVLLVEDPEKTTDLQQVTDKLPYDRSHDGPQLWPSDE